VTVREDRLCPPSMGWQGEHGGDGEVFSTMRPDTRSTSTIRVALTRGEIS
jgi:hypothetical protein